MKIEVRVWDPSEQHMSYGKPELSDDSIRFRFDHFGNKVDEFDDIVIMLWTGAIDRKKNKIFDGDLIVLGKEYVGYSQKPRVVEWDEEHFCFGVRNLHHSISPLSGFDLMTAYEVVGNIYENHPDDYEDD